MALTYIFGRSGYGKTEFIFQHAMSHNGRKYLLVPEQVSFEYEKKLIQRIPDTVSKDISIITFSSLSRRLFYETGGGALEVLNRAGKTLVIYRILKEINRNLEVFKKVELSRGIINSISSQIREFKNSMISYEELVNLSEKFDASSYLSKKLKDLSLIYKRYQDYIKDKYSDSEDVLSRVIEKMPRSSIFSKSMIYIDAFSSYSLLELNVIEALMLNNNDIYVSITGDRQEITLDYPVWDTAKKTIRSLNKIAERNNIDLKREINISGDNKVNSECISYLEKNLFNYSTSVYSKTVTGITLSKFQNPYSEIESVAKEIRRLVRSKMMRYRDISLIISDLSSYRMIIAELFDVYDIPYYIDDKIKFSMHSLGRYILDIMKGISDGYSYESMASILKSDYSSLSFDEADILENYVLLKGIRGLKWYDEDLFEEGNIRDIWRKFITPIHSLYLELKDDMHGREIAKSIYEFIQKSELQNIISFKISESIRDNDLILSNRLVQAYSILIKVIDDLYKIFDSVRISLKDIFAIFISAFAEYSIATIPFGMDEILIGDINKSKKEDVKAMFIIGANDGTFILKEAENNIFTESELIKIIETGFEKVSNPLDIINENENLLYSTLTRPKWILNISCPMAECTGKMLAPSSIFNRIKMIFSEMKIYQENAVTGIKEFESNSECTKRSILKDISIELRKRKAGSEVDKTYFELFEHFLQTDKQRIYKTVSNALRYTNDIEKIESDIYEQMFGSSFHGSISRLQKFRQCPFSFFMEYGIKAKDRKIRDFTSAQAGSFVHEVLEKFQKEIFGSITTINTEQIEYILSEIIERVLKDECVEVLSDQGIYLGIKKDLTEKLLTTCEIIYENTINSSFKPFKFEAEFKKDKEYPPIILKTDNGDEITIDGKIDRIDVYKDENSIYFAIFDYKTGYKTFSLSDVYHGLDLQLLVYLDALIKSDEDAKMAGAFYFHVKDPIIKGEPTMTTEEIDQELKKQFKLSGIAIDDKDILDNLDSFEKRRGYYQTLPIQISNDRFSRFSKVASAKQFFDMFEYIEKKLIELSLDIRGGFFRIKPIKIGKTTACDYCDYKRVCQFDTSIKQNRYDVLSNIKDEEFWNKVERVDNGQQVE